MPTSAAGSKHGPWRRGIRERGLADRGLAGADRDGPPPRGFTLIELMVVVALIAVATAGAVLSLRDSASTALERDAQRLAAMLEAGRARSRANDVPVVWQLAPSGFVLRGLAQPETLQPWLSADTRAQTSAPVVLGPEPLIAAQRIELFSASQPRQRLWVATDGLRPFAVQPAANQGTP